MADLAAEPDVKATLQVSDANSTVKGPKDDIAVSLVSPLDASHFTEFVSLRTREGQTPLVLPESGAVITEKLAERTRGPRRRHDLDRPRAPACTARLSSPGIAENYIFHYIYMGPSAFREVFGFSPESNGVLLKLSTADRTAEAALGTRLMAFGQVASVTYYSDAVGQVRRHRSRASTRSCGR